MCRAFSASKHTLLLPASPSPRPPLPLTHHAATSPHLQLSAALIIGGTTFEKEQAGVRTSNIVICTPGRLLQHMDETYNFECDNLQMLVLDEADRILDLGFEKAMNAIIQNLPTSRQTLVWKSGEGGE